MTNLQASIFLGALGISGIVGWTPSGRSAQLRAQMKAAWSRRYFLYPVRVGLLMAHVWGVGLIIVAIALAAPAGLAPALGVVGVGWLGVAVILGYLAPIRLFPRWLRTEIS